MQQVVILPGVTSWYLAQGYKAHVVDSCTYLTGAFRLVSTIRKKKDARLWGFESATEIQTAVMNYLAEYRIAGQALHNYKVSNLRYFRQKVQPFRDLPEIHSREEIEQHEAWLAALRSLPSSKLGNNNRSYPEFHKTIILRLYRDEERQVGLGAKPDGHEIWRRYKIALQAKYRELYEAGLNPVEKEFQAMTPQSVNRIISSAETRVLHGGARHGKAWEKRHARPHHKRGKPEIFGVLTGDGVSLGTLVKPGKGSKRSKSESLYIWMWRDWATGATLGWRFGRGGENIQMVIQSIGDVYLRFGLLPKTVQVDDKMKQKPEVKLFFERLGIRIMGKEIYNPQGLYAEVGNKGFNRTHRRVDEDWVNRTAHNENFTRNWEDLKDGKEIKSEEQARAMVERIITIENGRVREGQKLTPIERFTQGYADLERRPVDERFAAFYFGDRRTTSVVKGTFRLTPEANGQQYDYVLEDWTSHLPKDSDRFKIVACWLPSDPETVYAFSHVGESYLGTCTRKGEYNPDPFEQTDADRAEIARQSRQIQKFDTAKRNAQEALGQTEELYDLDRDLLVEELRKQRFADELERGQLPELAPAAQAEPQPEETEQPDDGPDFDEFINYRKS